VPIFAEINSRIASLMSCQRSDLWKTLLSTTKTSKCFSPETLASFGGGEQAYIESGVRYTIF